MLVGLLGGMLLASTGCGAMRCQTCGTPGTFGPNRFSGSCDDGCGPACGPMRGLSRFGACNDCNCDPCGCDPCGCDPCSCGRCWYRGPLSCVFAFFTPRFWCGPNCGERYWGDFYSDPPNCQDPCDCHGNFVGHGYRESGYPVDEYHEGGCPHCGHSANLIQEGDARPIPAGSTTSSRVISTSSKPTGAPHRATRS